MNRRSRASKLTLIFWRGYRFRMSSWDRPDSRGRLSLRGLRDLRFPSTTFSGIIDRAPYLHKIPTTIYCEERMSAKYIFVTGGVVSSLGKGLAAASIGCLLESRGLKVNLMKFDPYLNVDPGTMSPFQQ